MLKNRHDNELLNNWISITNIQMNITNELEIALQKKYNLSLKEFYVLYFLSQTTEKKLRLQQLQGLVGLSQSAISRLVSRLEEKSCGALERHVCDADRRGIYTRLTTIGEDKLQLALDTFEEVLKSLIETEDIRHEIQLLLEKL